MANSGMAGRGWSREEPEASILHRDIREAGPTGAPGGAARSLTPLKATAEGPRQESEPRREDGPVAGAEKIDVTRESDPIGPRGRDRGWFLCRERGHGTKPSQPAREAGGSRPRRPDLDMRVRSAMKVGNDRVSYRRRGAGSRSSSPVAGRSRGNPATLPRRQLWLCV